jgi:hypothetical protein
MPTVDRGRDHDLISQKESTGVRDDTKYPGHGLVCGLAGGAFAGRIKRQLNAPESAATTAPAASAAPNPAAALSRTAYSIAERTSTGREDRAPFALPATNRRVSSRQSMIRLETSGVASLCRLASDTAASTAPSPASPRLIPTKRVVDAMPDAMPARDGGMAPIRVWRSRCSTGQPPLR